MENLSFQQFVEWSFLAVIGGGVAFSSKFLCDISKSVSELNTSIATILERVNWHEKEIDDHSDRLKRLENRA